ncbi:MAG: preprotein translocase subunit YajC [Deltaproteobacteria bacterium]|nr:preprotein translocase subunit YajC [Deltaproteobacteria bacterium]
MINTAYAMGAPGGAGGAGGGDFSFIIMMAVLFGIFYFLLIRPQQKKQKEIKAMIANLAHGDLVMTSGGIQGKVTALTDTVVTIEIADKVKIKVARNFIAAVLQKATGEQQP